jgi:hypothetical protein
MYPHDTPVPGIADLAPDEKPPLRAVQLLLLGRTNLESSTVRYLGIEVDDALDTVEQTGV